MASPTYRLNVNFVLKTFVASIVSQKAIIVKNLRNLNKIGGKGIKLFLREGLESQELLCERHYPTKLNFLFIITKKL